MVADGGITKDEVVLKMTKLRDRETSISNRFTLIESELSNIPSQERVNALTKLGMAVLADISKDPKSIFKKSYEWKRNLIEHAFAGTDSNGKRLGVYIEREERAGNLKFVVLWKALYKVCHLVMNTW